MSRYPSETYIIGVGAGTGDKAMDAAKKAAQTDVVSQIRVQIQAEVKNISESFKFNNNEQLFSDFRSNVRTSVSDEIAGMEVAETVTDNSTGTAYALVVLERDKYCGTIRSELDGGWKQANDLRTGASDFAKQGKLNNAIQNLLEARKVISPLLTKQALYNAVSGAPYKPAFSFGPLTITADIRELFSDVKLSKKSGDKQTGKIGQSFTMPFVVQVTIDQDGSSVPVVGSTVVFETSDETKIGDATTDDQGLARLSTTVRALTGNGIRASLSFPNIGRDFAQNLQSLAVYFTWKAKASSISFSLKVDSNSPAMTSDLQRAFSSAITKLGYNVVSSSKFVVEVSVEPGQSSKIEGMAGTMYSVSASVVATLVDNVAGTTLASARFSGKGIGRTEDEAMDKAVGNVKISQAGMSDLLEKALQQ